MILPLLALLGLWLFRVRAVCGGLYPDDSGETLAAAWNLDIAHPPGDPLYALLGRLWLRIFPFGSLAFKGNLLSGALSLAAALLLYRLSLGFIRRRGGEGAPAALAGIAASGLAVLAPYFSLQASGAKGGVYVLNVILGAGAFLCLEAPGCAGLSASFLLLGLGLAHHWPSFLALAPGLVLAASLKEGRFRPARWSLALFSLVAGASLNLYLPLRAVSGLALNWGKPDGFSRFWDVLTRSVYVQAEGPGKGWTALREDGLVCLRHLGSEYLVLGLVMALYASWTLLRPDSGRGWKSELSSRALPLGLALSILSLILSIAIFPNPGEGIEFILMNYMILPTALIAPFLATGLSEVGSLLSSQLPPGFGGRSLAVRSAAALLLALQGWRGFSRGDLSRDLLALNYGRNILDTLKPNAILFGEGDHNVIPLYYLLYAEHLRPDVVLVTTVFQNFPWGMEVLKRRYPDLGLVESGEGLPGRLSQILAKKGNRPAYYSTLKGTLEETKLPVRDRLEADGLLLRLREEGERGKPGYRELAAPWNGYRLSFVFGVERDKDPNRVTVRRYYAGSLVNMGNAFQEDGWVDASMDPYQAALKAFGDCAPCFSNMAAAQGRLAAQHKDKGEALGRKGRVEEARGEMAEMQAGFNRARELLDRAERVDEKYAGTYANLGNVRLFEGDLVGALEAYQRALKEDPQAPAAQKNLQVLLTSQGPQLAAQYRLRGDAEARRAEEAKEGNNLPESERLRRQAAELYEKSLSYGAQDPTLLSNLGVMYAELGDVEKGEGAFRRALELSSKFEDGWKNMGVFYIKVGRFDQAVSLLTMAQKRFPDSKEIQRYLEVSVKASTSR